jgi:hypothetical protein
MSETRRECLKARIEELGQALGVAVAALAPDDSARAEIDRLLPGQTFSDPHNPSSRPKADDGRFEFRNMKHQHDPEPVLRGGCNRPRGAIVTDPRIEELERENEQLRNGIGGLNEWAAVRARIEELERVIQEIADLPNNYCATGRRAKEIAHAALDSHNPTSRPRTGETR